MDTVNQNTERLWDQLLQFIDEGRVIPVIGPELLMLEIDGQNNASLLLSCRAACTAATTYA